MANKVYGIDLGTTYSCIAVVDEFGRPSVINNADSQPTTPSVVWFPSATETVVGVQAKRNARVYPDNVVSLVKRHMGDGEWRTRVYDQDYSASAISALILRALAADAQRQTGEPALDAVITVPAYFGDEERKATKLAGDLAGLNVIDIINEPTAAAFAYGFAADGTTTETVLVYDLGGGTFDSTVIRLSERRIEVIATDGDHELGGADWDERIAISLAEQFTSANPELGDPLDDSYGAQDLISSAEEAKQSLTVRDSVDTMLIFGGGRSSITITREQYEELTASLLQRTVDLTRSVLAKAAEKGVTQVDRVLLVGGMSKSPAVARRLKEEFGYDAQLADPDLAVAKGAAIYGQKKELEQFVLDDLLAQGKLVQGQTLAEANPVDLSKSVGATAQTYGLSSDAVSDLVSTRITNVTSRGFGIEIVELGPNGQQTPVVEFLAHAQMTLPISSEQTFYTVETDQTAVQVRVLEQATSAESVRPGDNKAVVEGTISGIPLGYPQGTPVTVTFAMGTDQTILVSATHPGVPHPLVLTVDAGVSSAAMREIEQAKVSMLKQRA